jgi:hypothetical protein
MGEQIVRISYVMDGTPVVIQGKLCQFQCDEVWIWRGANYSLFAVPYKYITKIEMITEKDLVKTTIAKGINLGEDIHDVKRYEKIVRIAYILRGTPVISEGTVVQIEQDQIWVEEIVSRGWMNIPYKDITKMEVITGEEVDMTPIESYDEDVNVDHAIMDLELSHYGDLKHREECGDEDSYWS